MSSHIKNLKQHSRFEKTLLAAKYAFKFRKIFQHGKDYFSSVENAVHLKKLLIENGPLFIKFGQWLCERPDIFSEAFCRELEDLKTQVPYHDWAFTDSVLSNTFGNSKQGNHWMENFESFDTNPISSGSIAQVYRATLKGTRDNLLKPMDVIVKVRHPRVEERFLEDLGALSVFFDLGKALRITIFCIVEFEEIAQQLLEQIHLSDEALHMNHFKNNFSKNSYVSFPTPIVWTDQVLVESFEKGIFYEQIGSVKDNFVYHNKEEMEECKRICKQVTFAAYLQMSLHDGFIHGDCHSGNILYRISRHHDTNKIQVNVCFIDFGSVVQLEQVHRENHFKIVVGLTANDGELVVQSIQKLMIQSNQYQEKNFCIFKKECVTMVNDLGNRQKHHNGVPISVTMLALMKLVHKFELVIDSMTCRMMLGLILIEHGQKHDGENNLTSNTLRWIMMDDTETNFPLMPYASQILSAHATRDQKSIVGELPPVVSSTFLRDYVQNKEECLDKMDLSRIESLDCINDNNEKEHLIQVNVQSNAKRKRRIVAEKT